MARAKAPAALDHPDDAVVPAVSGRALSSAAPHVSADLWPASVWPEDQFIRSNQRNSRALRRVTLELRWRVRFFASTGKTAILFMFTLRQPKTLVLQLQLPHPLLGKLMRG